MNFEETWAKIPYDAFVSRDEVGVAPDVEEGFASCYTIVDRT